MRVLTFTSLYPNSIEPRHGIFVKNRMDYFDQIEGTSRNVIAPVQHFPLLGRLKSSKFSRYNKIPRTETQGNVTVFHPRYRTLPGSNLINVANAMASAAEKILPEAYPDGETFDVIDGHYLYPDGVAAFKIAQKHRKPLILTARGSDVNFWLTRPGPRDEIMEALNYAAKIICVSQALKNILVTYGIPEKKLIVLMNGVENALFNAEISAHRPEEPYLLSVGNLVPLKGHEYILRAMPHFPTEKLIIIGRGEMESPLKSLAAQLNIMDRVTFLTHVPHHELAPYYVGAKCTILMSASEGMPNVILESLACGTPVIATNVGGIPEVVTKDNGLLLPERTTIALTNSLKICFSQNWNRQKISQGMKHLDWHETAGKLHSLFSEALNSHRS